MSSKQYSAATDIGLKRSNNEDTVLSSPEMGLWLVADGMGGHAAGEVASAIAAETVQKEVAGGAALEHAIRQAHKAVIAAASAGVGGAGMGSTIVALHSHGKQYDVAWVGDSRAYLWQPSADELIQLTTDHSYVQMLFDSGAISAQEMQEHPDRNVITQCLGSPDVDTVAVDSCRMSWYPGDCVLLCSDGLSDSVDEAQMSEILRQHQDVDSATRELIALALAEGGGDNISVLLVRAPDEPSRGVAVWGRLCKLVPEHLRQKLLRFTRSP